LCKGQTMKFPKFSPRISTISLISFILSITAASVLLAQTTPPEATPEATAEATAEPTDCTPQGLIAAQAALQAQLDDFAAQIVDEENASSALEALYQVGTAYEQIAIDCGYIPADIGERFVGTDIENILAALEELSGDPIRGQLLYNNEEPAADGSVLACAGCHEGGAVGPTTAGTWTRWDEVRRLDPALANNTFEHFMTESILLPNAYVPPEYSANMMPQNYGDRLSYQDLADLIIYLESQDQFLDQ